MEINNIKNYSQILDAKQLPKDELEEPDEIVSEEKDISEVSEKEIKTQNLDLFKAACKSQKVKKEDELFAHQSIPIKYWSEHPEQRSLILAMEPGTGKTKTYVKIERMGKYDFVIFFSPGSLHGISRKELIDQGANPDELVNLPYAEDIKVHKYYFVTANAHNTYEQWRNAFNELDPFNFLALKSLGKELKKTPIGYTRPKILIIMDEVHQFSLRVTHILNRAYYKEYHREEEWQKGAIKIYEDIKNYDHFKIIMATGTPMSNEEFDLIPAINMARGRIYGQDGRYDFAFPEMYSVYYFSFVKTSLTGAGEDQKSELLGGCDCEKPDNTTTLDYKPTSEYSKIKEENASRLFQLLKKYDNLYQEFKKFLEKSASYLPFKDGEDKVNPEELSKKAIEKLEEMISQGASDRKIYTELRKIYIGNGFENVKLRSKTANEFIDDKQLLIRAAIRVKEISNILPKNAKIKSAIDFGCGDGGLISAIAEKYKIPKEKAFGLDITKLKPQKTFTFKLLDSNNYKLDFEDKSIDLITVLMVLHHVRDPPGSIEEGKLLKSYISEFKRILSPNGHLIIREHDFNQEGLDILLDIIHGMYSLVLAEVPENIEFPKGFYALYREKGEWKNMIESLGFKSINSTEPEKSQKMYYELFKINTDISSSTTTTDISALMFPEDLLGGEDEYNYHPNFDAISKLYALRIKDLFYYYAFPRGYNSMPIPRIKKPIMLYCPMEALQESGYYKAKFIEKDLEKKMMKDIPRLEGVPIVADAGTFLSFTRQACNVVFPNVADTERSGSLKNMKEEDKNFANTKNYSIKTYSILRYIFEESGYSGQIEPVIIEIPKSENGENGNSKHENSKHENNDKQLSGGSDDERDFILQYVKDGILDMPITKLGKYFGAKENISFSDLVELIKNAKTTQKEKVDKFVDIIVDLFDKNILKIPMLKYGNDINQLIRNLNKYKLKIKEKGKGEYYIDDNDETFADMYLEKIADYFTEDLLLDFKTDGISKIDFIKNHEILRKNIEYVIFEFYEIMTKYIYMQMLTKTNSRNYLHPVIIKDIVKRYSIKNILDLNTSYGDVLIGSIISGVKKYYNFDEKLKDKYQEIMKTFAPKSNILGNIDDMKDIDMIVVLFNYNDNIKTIIDNIKKYLKLIVNKKLLLCYHNKHFETIQNELKGQSLFFSEIMVYHDNYLNLLSYEPKNISGGADEALNLHPIFEISGGAEDNIIVDKIIEIRNKDKETLKPVYDFIIGHTDGKGLIWMNHEDISSVFTLTKDKKDNKISIDCLYSCISKLYVNDILTFPLKKYYIDPVDEMFDELKQHEIIKDTSDILPHNIRFKSQLLPLNYRGKDGGNYLTFRNKKHDYDDIDCIADHFMEQNRLTIKRKGFESPIEYWHHEDNIKEILINALDNYDEITNYSIRESFEEAIVQFEPRHFEPTIAKAIIKEFGSKRVIDFCAGLGNKLIGSIAADVDYYFGVDANKELKEGYDEIIKILGRNKFDKYQIEFKPFEEVNIEKSCGDKAHFDFIFTSPPFFDFEKYTNLPGQSIDKYKEFNDWFLKFIFRSIEKCWDVLEENGKFAMYIIDMAKATICEPLCLLILWKLKGAAYDGVINFINNENIKPKPIWVFTKNTTSATKSFEAEADLKNLYPNIYEQIIKEYKPIVKTPSNKGLKVKSDPQEVDLPCAECSKNVSAKPKIEEDKIESSKQDTSKQEIKSEAKSTPTSTPTIKLDFPYEIISQTEVKPKKQIYIHSIFSMFVNDFGLNFIAEILKYNGMICVNDLNDTKGRKIQDFEDVEKILIREKKFGFILISGEIEGKDKARLLSFVNHKRNAYHKLIRIILFSKAAGHGFSILNSNFIWFFDLTWDPASEKQVKDRLCRLFSGSYFPENQRWVQAIYCQSVIKSGETTSDFTIANILNRKSFQMIPRQNILKASSIYGQELFDAENSIHKELLQAKYKNGSEIPQRIYTNYINCDTPLLPNFILQKSSEIHCIDHTTKPNNKMVKIKYSKKDFRRTTDKLEDLNKLIFTDVEHKNITKYNNKSDKLQKPAHSHYESEEEISAESSDTDSNSSSYTFDLFEEKVNNLLWPDAPALKPTPQSNWADIILDRPIDIDLDIDMDGGEDLTSSAHAIDEVVNIKDDSEDDEINFPISSEINYYLKPDELLNFENMFAIFNPFNISKATTIDIKPTNIEQTSIEQSKANESSTDKIDTTNISETTLEYELDMTTGLAYLDNEVIEDPELIVALWNEYLKTKSLKRPESNKS